MLRSKRDMGKMHTCDMLDEGSIFHEGLKRRSTQFSVAEPKNPLFDDVQKPLLCTERNSCQLSSPLLSSFSSLFRLLPPALNPTLNMQRDGPATRFLRMGSLAVISGPRNQIIGVSDYIYFVDFISEVPQHCPICKVLENR